MTAKRFTINSKEIIQNKQVWCMANSEHCADVIATAMNELSEENEQLKTDNGAFIQDIEVFKEENTHLKLENEQLKNDVYDWKASAEDYLKLGKSLKKENEQLKSEYKVLHTQYQDLKKFVENNFDEHLTQEKLNRQILKLSEENEQLKQQLLYDGDDVCGICKHEYLVPSEDYFIGKCKKGHKECSKEDIKYCEDFEFIQVDFDDLIKRMDKELEE